MRTLVACMTYIRTKAQMDLLLTWYALSRKLNPGVDYLIVDSASPICPLMHLPDGWNVHHFRNDDEIPKQDCPRLFARFGEALGHPNYDRVTNRAGSDRAWMKIMEIAIASKYDLLAYLEADILCVQPVARLSNAMHKPSACAPMVYHGVFPETGIFLAKTVHLSRVGFVRKYDWKNRDVQAEAGETRAWNILYEGLEFLPLKGERNCFRTEAHQYDEHFPDGLDFLTHAYPSTLKVMMERAGHLDCWRMDC